MIAADRPVHRPHDAKLLWLDSRDCLTHVPRDSFARLLRAGDLVVANDAATLPASLQGTHSRTGASIEVRLAARRSLDVGDVREFDAIVFGGGDFRTPTENRALPPALLPRDALELGPLRADVRRLLDHPRFVTLRFEGTPDRIWAGLARHGKPIQYAHHRTELALWDVWTSNAALPVAFEPPSAGFLLSWKMLGEIRDRGAAFATLTHSAGISSTGDLELDRRLPLDEPYHIPRITAQQLRSAKRAGARVIAVGTTVVRALEHAATSQETVRAGFGLATQRIARHSTLRVVDAILSGVHEPGTSHFELLQGFANRPALEQMSRELQTHLYKTHEFGDSVLIEKSRAKYEAVRAGHAVLHSICG